MHILELRKRWVLVRDGLIFKNGFTKRPTMVGVLARHHMVVRRDNTVCTLRDIEACMGKKRGG